MHGIAFGLVLCEIVATPRIKPERLLSTPSGGVDEDSPYITSLAVACHCGSPTALPEPVCGRASTEACSGSFRVAGKAAEARSHSRSAAGGAAADSRAKGRAVTGCHPRRRRLSEGARGVVPRRPDAPRRLGGRRHAPESLEARGPDDWDAGK